MRYTIPTFSKKRYAAILVLASLLFTGLPVEELHSQAAPLLPPELVTMFPVGREFKGVAIPRYDGTKLQSVMRSETVVRINEQFLHLTKLTIDVYNGAGEPETTISMDEAEYDLTIGEMASKTPAKIEQPRFTMTGDKMTFETKTKVSRMIGNVRVIIDDVGDLGPQFGKKKEK